MVVFFMLSHVDSSQIIIVKMHPSLLLNVEIILVLVSGIFSSIWFSNWDFKIHLVFLSTNLKTNLCWAILTNSSISSVGVKLTIDLESSKWDLRAPSFGPVFRFETGPEIVKGLYSVFTVRREPRVRPRDWLVLPSLSSSGVSSISL